MVPFYTTKISTVILAFSLITGRGLYGSIQALSQEKTIQGSVVETQEESASTETTATPEPKIEKIDTGKKTNVLPTEEPTPEPTPEATPEPKKETSSNSSNSGENSNSSSQSSQSAAQPAQQPVQQPMQQETQQEVQPAQESTPEPQPEQGEGYYSDMKACMAAARSANALNYSCSPLNDGQWYLWWTK